ncbi:MAG: SDR family oxidoreductase [Vampirovibrio sp.]|nr:SDR family oxidoreductase [Vampirovibrio sp.]
MDHTPVYLITGATGGIGSTLCRQLMAQNASVSAISNNLEKLNHLAQETGVHTLEADVRSYESLEQAVTKTHEHFGRLDGVVNCTGSILLKPAHLTSVEDWNNTLSLNLTAGFYLLKASIRYLKKTPDSVKSVVFLSSAAATTGLKNHDAIAAAKAGLNGLVRSAAATYAPQGIRVNAVAPGLVETPLAEKLLSSPAALAASERLHPLGRIGQPDDIASAVCWLLDAKQSWVTGQIIGVDGGLAALKGA